MIACKTRAPRRGAVAVELAFSLCFVIIPMLLGIWRSAAC